jgi:tight adherence protein C
MLFAIFSFCAIFLLITSGGLLLFYRQQVLQRISSVINENNVKKDDKQTGLRSSIQSTGSSLGNMVEQFERVMPKSQAEMSVMQTRLIRAGFREDSAIKIFYGTKVLVPLVLCLVALVTGLGSASPFFVYTAALALGFLGPDFVLGRLITRRQKEVRLGLPDALDLLVICIEAGLSLDQATARTAEELGNAQPAISDELNMVVLEQRAGRPRAEAWKHMEDRTGVDCVRNLVAMLVQSEQFGTSVAKTLRVHSDTLRTQRVQAVEEMASKTTIKLIFPLVLFIFPSLFVVVLGPAAILMSESFKQFLTH